jgi:hypothetical protein
VSSCSSAALAGLVDLLPIQVHSRTQHTHAPNPHGTQHCETEGRAQNKKRAE